MKLSCMSALLATAALVTAVSGYSSSEPGVASSTTPSIDASPNPRVDQILEQSCGSCHTKAGSAPWYASIAPTYIASGSAVRALNLAGWQKYTPQERVTQLAKINQALTSGSMPPHDFTLLDHAARLSEEEKKALLEWTSSAMAAH